MPPKAAALIPAAMNPVIGVGAPWYASGSHMWNGTAATLNSSATRIESELAGSHLDRSDGNAKALRQQFEVAFAAFEMLEKLAIRHLTQKTKTRIAAKVIVESRSGNSKIASGFRAVVRVLLESL